jgi:small subunit ribosomal protein S3
MRPLNCLRKRVFFGCSMASYLTRARARGVRARFKGEILEHDPMAQDKKAQEEGGRSGGRRERDGEGP